MGGLVYHLIQLLLPLKVFWNCESRKFSITALTPISVRAFFVTLGNGHASETMVHSF